MGDGSEIQGSSYRPGCSPGGPNSPGAAPQSPQSAPQELHRRSTGAPQPQLRCTWPIKCDSMVHGKLEMRISHSEILIPILFGPQLSPTPSVGLMGRPRPAEWSHMCSALTYHILILFNIRSPLTKTILVFSHKYQSQQPNDSATRKNDSATPLPALV